MHHPNLLWPHDLVIDHPDRVERLMDQRGAALPIPARPTPELQATLQDQRNVALPMDCRVTWISYAGEAGGIIRKLVPAADLAAEAVFASIAHLGSDPRMPLALEIAVYQRHRVKRLRSQKPQPKAAAAKSGPPIQRNATGAAARRLPLYRSFGEERHQDQHGWARPLDGQCFH